MLGNILSNIHQKKELARLSKFVEDIHSHEDKMKGLSDEGILKIREKTQKGTINLNTNGSWPERVRTVARKGLDSIRISLNSARPECYRAYFRPRDYDFHDVVDSISLSREMGL